MTQTPTPAARQQHTPGPWRIELNADAPDRIYDADGNMVADVFCCDMPEGEANARLIAAAPELLATLLNRRTRDMLDGSPCWCHAEGKGFMHSELCRQARAAIARALLAERDTLALRIARAFAALGLEPIDSPDALANAVGAVHQERDALRATVADLLAALQGIIDIGKRDTTNPKYDGYFASARAAIARATGAQS